MSAYHKASAPATRLARYRLLAPTANIRVSPLCLGAMTFGEKQQERYGVVTKDEAFKIMDTFYQAGGNFIDTANMYQYGQSEEWVGEWMAKRGNRDEMVIATKYTGPHRANEKDRIQVNFIGTGTKNMKLSIDESLKALGTSYIDLYYVHWWDYAISIPELMHSLNDLVVSGKVNYLGISDTPAWIVSKANEYARNHGLRQFVVYQGLWNAGMRDVERDIIPMAKHEGMALCPWGVLGQGRFQTEERYQERETNKEGRNGLPLSEHDKSVSKHLERIADRRDCDLLNVALAYVLQKTPYVFPIVGGRKAEHLSGNIKALEVSLTPEDMAEIETAYAFDHGFPHSFLSGTLFANNPNGPHKGASSPKDVFFFNGVTNIDWVDSAYPITPN